MFWTGFIAFLKAVPALKNWFDSLVALYVARVLASMKAENIAAIKAAIDTHDQRRAEAALGNPTPGEPSGNPGTEIRDNIPGVNE